jgi:hypothetical protein
MSTIYTQYKPEDFGAGSGLIWLGDTYSYAQVTGMWPNVKWGYLYSGYTNLGTVSDYSMIKIASGMQTYWNTYSGMYVPGCYWTTQFFNTSGVNCAYLVTGLVSSLDYLSNDVRIYYSGANHAVLNPGSSLTDIFGYRTYLATGIDGTGFIEIPPEGAYTNVSAHPQHYYAGGTWAIHEGAGSVSAIYSGITLYSTDTNPEGIGVVETCKTYSGAYADSWKEWTQDEAAIMEAYERTVGPIANMYDTISGNAWSASYTCPKLFSITPGLYYTSYGHIWFHTTCDIDAKGAKFQIRRKTGQHMGYSPTWRAPTGDEAKAAITVGTEYHKRYPKLGPIWNASPADLPYTPNSKMQDCDIYLPSIASYGVPSTWHYGQYDGAGIRLLAQYNTKIRNINAIGAFRYGVIFCNDDIGSSYNEYHFTKLYNFLVGIKFRFRHGSNNQAWLNNSRWDGGMCLQASPKSTWDPNVNPTVLFDNDNSALNPNMDRREDAYIGLPSAALGLSQFYHSPTFWSDNFATELNNIVYFIRASGWNNVTFRKGRFESLEDPLLNPQTNTWQPRRRWWLRGDVTRNIFEDTVSNSALQGLPEEYIGRGIDFIQYNQPLPGFSEKGVFTPFKNPDNTSAGLNHSTYNLSQDLYLNRPGAELFMVDATGEKMRSIYIDDITDPVSGRQYPVVKAKPTPHVWMKWKLSTEDDTEYSTKYRKFPVGSTVHFKFGDFESIPTTSATTVYRPKMRLYMTWIPGNQSTDDLVGFSPSGLVNGIAGTSGNYTYNWFADNANVINNSYVEAAYTFNQSGIVYPRLFMSGYLVNSSNLGYYKIFDYMRHLHRIEITDVPEDTSEVGDEYYLPIQTLTGSVWGGMPVPPIDLDHIPEEDPQNNTTAEDIEE